MPHGRCARLLCSAAIIAVLGAGAAQAAEAKFNISPQRLDQALSAFSEQSQQAVLLKPEIGHAKISPGVVGSLEPEAALTQMLRGTGLAFEKTGGAFLIVQAGEGGSSPQSAGAGGDVEALIVTAQKREENIQDVPIAISAFSQQALEDQKIEGGFDLLKAIPNVTFSKSNYSSYNFSIRGVGTKAVSATSDPGVAVSFNNVSLIRNRLFEQEYLDVSRVEVLRGPQGTLYGRNATAGVINVISARPELDSFEAKVKGEVGDFETRRVSAMANIPLLEDHLAVRFAAAATERQGYGVNLTTGADVDGRDLWSSRVSVAYAPTERLRVDLVWEHFEEDDNRLRTGKQLCHRDPGPENVLGTPVTDVVVRGRLSQGCLPGSLYDDGAFGAPNGFSIPFVVAGQRLTILGQSALPGAPGRHRVTLLQPGVDPFGGKQSRDLRVMESMYDPRYRAKADIYSLNLDFDVSDGLSLISQTLYNVDEVYSFQDYHRFATFPNFSDSSGLYATSGTAPSPYRETVPDGFYNDPQVGSSDRLAGFEISSSESRQFSQELRLQSDFDGGINFAAGANYTRFKGLNDYYLFYNIVTAIAQVQYNRSPTIDGCNNGAACITIDPNPVESLQGDGHNYFRNQNPYKLESKAMFGEAYWRISEDLKLTAGLRYTDDRKSFTPWRSQLMQFGFDYYPDPTINQRWTEVSGRLGLDWSPVLPFTDDTLLYAFYSRGYKGGGANPPPAALPEGFTLPVDHPATFAPEFVNAFEIGAKNSLLGGALVVNASAFYYDYTDYQISKVVDRTVVNETFDATTWGLELEGVWRLSHNLRVNASLGYLDTKIADGERSIDIFNRTQGQPGWGVLTPWLQQTSNCILPLALIEEFVGDDRILTACTGYISNFTDLGLDFDPSEFPEINNGTGFYDDLSGNELPNAPHWTFNVGAQYTAPLGAGWEATVRGDYYRQSQSFARVYNAVNDKLRAWDNTNLTLRLERPDQALAIELYAKNVFDKTPITDAFLNSDSTGMTTNIFVLDPRLIGLSISKGF